MRIFSSSSLALFALCCCVSFLATSCSVVRLHHIGRMYPPSPSIDVVFAERDVKAQRYEFMGEILLETTEEVITQAMEGQLIYEARLRGANAVIMGEIDARFASPPGPETIIRVVRARLVRYL